jgi:hypothetical protein
MEVVRSAKINPTPNRNNLSLKKKKGISIFSERQLTSNRQSQPNLQYLSLMSRLRLEESNKREIQLIVRRKDDDKLS